MTRRPPREGASLVEVLVVIGVVGVVVAMVLPAVQAVRGAAGRAACENHLRQIGLALHAHHDRHGRLPPDPVRGGFSDPNATLSWMGLLLPDVEQGPLWAQTTGAYRADGRPFRDPPHVGYSTVVRVYTCPADGRLGQPLRDSFGVVAAYGSYLGISGAAVTAADGVLGPEPGVRFADVTDGLSQTVAVGERPPPDSLRAGRWYSGTADAAWGDRGPDEKIPAVGIVPLTDPACALTSGAFGYGRTDNPCDRYHLWSLHPGGANFLLADGAVRFLPYPASAALPALATRAGGESQPLPD